MNAFVTGSSGFLGTHLTRALLDRGDTVVGLVRDHVCARDHFPPEDRRITVHGDLSSIAFLERILAEHEIEIVFHLAAQTQVSVAALDPAGSCEANVRGTWNVLEAYRRQKVKRLVMANSDKVYGDGLAPYREDQALFPSGIYATTKAVADLLAQSYMRQYDLPIAIARCGNLYGPGHRNFSTLIPDAIRCALTDRVLLLRSDGKMRRDFLFIRDAVEGYLKLADAQDVGAFNFGTERPTSVIEVLRQIGAAGLEIRYDIRNTARAEIRDQWLDCSKAHSRLNWTAATALPEGIAATIPWYREYFHVS